MRLHKIIIAAMILLLLPLYSHASKHGVPRIGLVEGDVQVRSESATHWISALINMPLMDGDEIQVPEGGRIEIQLHDGSFIRLDENSALVLQKTYYDDFRFHLEKGQAYINFAGHQDSAMKIDTPVAFIRTYNKAKFRIDTHVDYTEISVLKGAVHADSLEETIKVYAGKTLSIDNDLYTDLYPLGISDEWERWNRSRDREFEREVYSSRYLPEELRIYSNDLNENGDWIYTRKYGYVWKPTVFVSAGWSPYRAGRWLMRNSDYVWISYELWGWVPYHYGRWAHNVTAGWFWIPPASEEVYWGPGYVGWVYTPEYVAWVPLAPGDVYYGYGYYGPRSVNIIKINIGKPYGKIIYKNVYVNNAVTVIYKNTFMSGKHRKFRTRGNPFLQKKVYFGRPKIKHKKVMYKTVVKKPSRKYEIRKKQIKKIKREYRKGRDTYKRRSKPEYTVKKVIKKNGDVIKVKKRKHGNRMVLKKTTHKRKRHKPEYNLSEKDRKHNKVLTDRKERISPKNRYASKQFKKNGATIEKVKKRNHVDKFVLKQTKPERKPYKEKYVSFKENRRDPKAFIGKKPKKSKKSRYERKQNGKVRQEFAQIKRSKKQRDRAYKRNEKQKTVREKAERKR
ncbi:MAG: FecR family protein [Nitrospirota bacterium]